MPDHLSVLKDADDLIFFQSPIAIVYFFITQSITQLFILQDTKKCHLKLLLQHPAPRTSYDSIIVVVTF